MKTMKTAHNISVPAETRIENPPDKAKSVFACISLLVNKVSRRQVYVTARILSSRFVVNMWSGRIYLLRGSTDQFQDFGNLRWGGCHILKAFCVWVSVLSCW
jgi:hypothetical protein